MEARFNTMIFKDTCESGYSIKINGYMIEIVMKDGIPCVLKEELSEVLDHKIFDLDWLGNFLLNKKNDGLLPLHELESTLLSIQKSNKSQRGFIYLISDGEFTKIGLTDKKTNIRLASLQTGNARKLTIVGEYETKNRYAEEKRLHNIFRSQHISGEWFSLTNSDIKMILLSGDAEYKEKESFVLNDEEVMDLYFFLSDIFKKEYKKHSDDMANIFKKYFYDVHGKEMTIDGADSNFFNEVIIECKALDSQEKSDIANKIWQFNYQTEFVEKHNKYMKFNAIYSMVLNRLTA
ncbi:hypothetical protein EOM39_07890 [Candidatus Gracilibacteria bacterium]|nr:hypothetical protein [Candidatus Gracilibacteria bacterium]